MDWNVIDQLIQEKSLLKHEFYTAWSQGQLVLDDLRFYACQYYALETTFPRLSGHVYASCENPQMRQVILENMIDEERGEENHRELWLRFADALGLEREQVIQAERHPATTECLERLLKLAADPDIKKGLASLYAYESQLPSVSRSKIDGLKRFYGINDPRALSFFEVHEQADVWHSEQEKTLLTELGAEEDDVRAAVVETCSALWKFLDGVNAATRLKRLGHEGAKMTCQEKSH